MKGNRRLALLLALLLFCLALPLHGCGEEAGYARAENWAFLEGDREGTADVFFVAPTVYGGAGNLSLDDREVKTAFTGSINMEAGIYRAEGIRFFAPFYRQAGLEAYTLPEAEREKYLALAYGDVKDAFSCYLARWNEGRPLILAGFSQGADHCIRLMKDFFGDPALQKRLVACYAIGWRVTEEELAAYPQLRMAQGERDTGVVVSFNTEAEGVEDSLMVPEGVTTRGINPLNWRTDGEPADRSLNLGACFTDYSGNILSELPALTGCYLDPVRGTLKVTDIVPEDYPPGLSLFPAGVYHLYDYQFFYRNLQENVAVRLQAYFAASLSGPC